MKLWGAAELRLLVVASALAGCADCEDEIAAAGRFLSSPENLQCQTDDDCVVVGTGCHTFEGGLCAQSQLSRAAASSSSWEEMAADLDDCYDDDDEECIVCTALLLPACTEGMCRRPGS